MKVEYVGKINTVMHVADDVTVKIKGNMFTRAKNMLISVIDNTNKDVTITQTTAITKMNDVMTMMKLNTLNSSTTIMSYIDKNGNKMHYVDSIKPRRKQHGLTKLITKYTIGNGEKFIIGALGLVKLNIVTDFEKQKNVAIIKTEYTGQKYENYNRDDFVIIEMPVYTATVMEASLIIKDILYKFEVYHDHVIVYMYGKR